MTTPHKSFEERVDEVLKEHALYHSRESKGLTTFEARHALLAAHKEKVERIIGEDGEVTGYMRPQGYMSIDMTQSYYNALRAEQRTRANLTRKEES